MKSQLSRSATDITDSNRLEKSQNNITTNKFILAIPFRVLWFVIVILSFSNEKMLVCGEMKSTKDFFH